MNNDKRPATAKFYGDDDDWEPRPWVKFFRLGPFSTGVVVTICVLALWSDFLGLDAFTAWIRDHWQSARYTVPFYTILLLAALTARLVDYIITDDENRRKYGSRR